MADELLGPIKGMPVLQGESDTPLALASFGALLMEGRGVQDPIPGSLLLSLCRLLDSAISEYAAARRLLEIDDAHEYVRTLFRAVSHLETAITSTHRSIEALVRIRTAGLRLNNGEPLVRRPKQLPVLSDSVRTRYRELRDAIQHLEERTVRRKAPAVALHMLIPRRQSLTLEGIRLRYTDWASHLDQLHSEASKLLDIWQEDDGSYKPLWDSSREA